MSSTATLAPRAKTAPLLFRPMTEADLPRVSTLAYRIWNDYYPPIIGRAQTEHMQALFNTPAALKRQTEVLGYQFILAEQEGAIIGFVSIRKEGYGHFAIGKFYVDTACHGTGVGRTMMNELIARFAPKALTLCVARRNIRAINFYFRMGFTLSGIEETDIGGGFTMDDFVMTRVFP